LRILRCGDPHIRPNNLKESEALMDFVLSKAAEFKVDRLEILGDLMDTHAVVRLEVLEFWQKWFETLSIQKFKSIVLVGNHDVSGNYASEYSALHPFLSLENDNFKIVHAPYLDDIYGYLPYIHSNEEFVKKANELASIGAKVLVSHPNYKGAVYDNGMPITGAVDPDDLSEKLVHLIGGHIHTEIEIGRVWYTGNPRWMTKSCANKKKGIWLCNHDDVTGKITSKKFVSTETVCTPIISLVWKENEPKPEVQPNTNTDIELIGSSDWVTKQKLELKGLVTVSSKITDTKKSRERQSGRSLHEFLSHHYQTDKREKLITYMKGLDFFG
jgi:hypothetical protein